MLSCDSDRKLFTEPESISLCLKLLENFCDRALQSEHSPWESVNIHGYEKIRAELEESYKVVRVVSDVESSSSLGEPIIISEKLPKQRHRPAQRPRIDLGKTHYSGVIGGWLIAIKA